MLRFDLTLSNDEVERFDALPPSAWFTAVQFNGYATPQPPALAKLDGANARKTALVMPWIADVVPGTTVLDTFAANGAFSIHCALVGAASVHGVEWDANRVAAANLLASVLADHSMLPVTPTFQVADAYDISGALAQRAEQFDVTLCLGGLYHVADPAHVLRQIRAVTKSHLIVQTSCITRGRRNRARFTVRHDATDRGLTSHVGGSGKWYMTSSCFREILKHGGFEVIEEHVRIPAYAALCRAV